RRQGPPDLTGGPYGQCRRLRAVCCLWDVKFTKLMRGDNMPRRRCEYAFWLKVLTLASTLLWSITVLAQESIGEVTALQGQATVQRTGSAQAMPLHVQSPVYRGDTIKTLEASKIKLLLIDGTGLTLGERGTMTLSQL